MRQVFGGPLTFHVGLRAADSGLDPSVVRGALELALRMGEAVLGGRGGSSGASELA